MTLFSTPALLCLVLLPAALNGEAPFAHAERAASAALGMLTDGRLAEAADHARQALQASDERLGPDHPLTALARRNLAICLWHLGRFTESEAELLKARASLFGSQGESGPGSLRTALDLAGLYSDMGRQIESASLFERAWRLAPGADIKREAAMGAAKAFFAAADEASAKTVLEAIRASAKNETLLALTLAEAETWLKTGQAEKALDGFGKALEMGRQIHGTAHPFLAPSQEGQARSLAFLGRKEEAESTWHKALQGRRRTAGPLTYASLPSHEALARLLLDMGRKSEGRELLKQILALREKIQPSHPAIHRIREKL